MTDVELEECEICGNHAVVSSFIEGEVIKECEVCGALTGPAEITDLVQLQREAEGLGVSIHSFPLAQLIDSLPGIRLQGDSGGEKSTGRMPFIAFEVTDQKISQLKNLGQALRLMGSELQCKWKIEFTFEYEMGFELSAIRDLQVESAKEVEAARADLIHIWRRLVAFQGLAWWKQ